LSLLCVSVDMFAPTYEHPHPLVDRLLPMAMAGDFARALIAKQPFGVDGPAALGPLFVVWTILGWPLARLVAVGTRAT